jgi:hypothetical protein
MINIRRRPWFRIFDSDDLRTVTKAFIVGGIISAYPGLTATGTISVLRDRLRRLLGPERSRAVAWAYPGTAIKPGILLSAADLADLFDAATARRGSLTEYGPWSAALRLEVPVSIEGRVKIGGSDELTLEELYNVLGISGDAGFSASFPISVSFAAAKPRGAISFDWPLRVGSRMPGIAESWAARNGYADVMHPDSLSPLDLILIDAKGQPAHPSAGSVTALADFDTTAVDWRNLAIMGAVVVPGFASASMAPWIDGLTRSLSHDRPFDVAVFEAWDTVQRQGIASSGPPLLVGGPGAFDQARLSKLVSGTIRSLQSHPRNSRFSIPQDIADRLDVPSEISAPALADTLQRSRPASTRNLSFFADRGGGRLLSVIRPQMSKVRPRRSPATQPDDHLRHEPLSGNSEIPAPDAEEKRRINAWIEDGEPPLEKGHTYQLGVNIGKRRQHALADAEFPNVEWKNEQSLQILVVISGHGLVVKPRERLVTLPRNGDSEPAYFSVTPVLENSDTLLLRISLYLARELTLLEEFEIPIRTRSAIMVA